MAAFLKTNTYPLQKQASGRSLPLEKNYMPPMQTVDYKEMSPDEIHALGLKK
jgi:hypothetical protein